MDLELRRQFYAEEIAAVANLRTQALIDALRTVPRERFLPPGPWTVGGDDSGPRQTVDADVSHVYHDYSIAIDPARQLFNGHPSFMTGLIERLALKPGDAVLHVGAGTGYYSALIAHVVGPGGHVTAVEVDAALAEQAGRNLQWLPSVDVTGGDATNQFDRRLNAILVNAGVTHPLHVWLDALATGGRLILPLTATIPSMGRLSKGVTVLVTKAADDTFDARVLTFVVIYSAVGIRDADLNQQLGEAMMRMPFPRLKRLRRDPHERSSQCWFHGTGFCFSAT